MKQLIEDAGQIDWEKPSAFVFSYTDTALRQFIEATPELWEGHPLPPAYSLGCTIGTHIGPNAYGFAFFEK
jgi:fatty acid-binding protein DegV